MNEIKPDCVFVTTGIQHTVRIGHVARSALQYFFILYHKWRDFRKKNVTEHKMCDSIFSANFSEKNILSEEEMSEM